MTTARHPIYTMSAAGTASIQAPPHQVRAHFTDTSVFVYQAFRSEIANPAVREQRFVPPFGRSRMTWIKPSFAWMMYRSGWATKAGQEHVLRVEVLRSGFEWVLSRSCLTGFSRAIHRDLETWKSSLRESPARVQWDPERTLLMEALPWRTIQVGIGPAAVGMYADEWALSVEDFTETALKVREAVRSHNFLAIDELLPAESPYPVPRDIARRIAADSTLAPPDDA